MTKKETLYEYIVSDRNIYMAIYAVKTYVFDPQLLIYDDKKLLNELSDPFAETKISEIICDVKKILERILNDNNAFFLTKVYYKPKDYNEKDGEIYRPIHTARLRDLIAMVAMLHPLIYEVPKEENNWKLNLSNYSRLIPNNFYGNRVSRKPEELFKIWNKQYKKYTQKANEYFKTYHTSKEYKYELKLDLKNFFPSVDPLLVFQILMEQMPVTFDGEDEETLKKVIYKLLICEVDNLKNETACQKYYGKLVEDKIFTRGIAQGLPQSYFFGNICMIEIAKIFDMEYSGKSVYYVDDSYIYTNTEIQNNDEFQQQLKNINKKIQAMSYEKIQKANLDSFVQSENNYFKFYKELTKGDKDFYKIEVHTKEKSTFTKIEDAKEGEVYLRTLSREASQIGTDMSSAYSDEEDITLLHRTEALLNAINKEIKNIENKSLLKDIDKEIENVSSNDKGYLEKLIRYYKFFKYREIKLRLRVEKEPNRNIIEALVGKLDEKEFENGYENLKKNVSKELFFENYKNDIWQTALSVLISNEILEPNMIKEYIKRIMAIAYNSDLKECSYIETAYRDYIDDKALISTTSCYSFLEKATKHKMIRYANMHNELLKKEFLGVKLNNIKKDILGSFGICSPEFIEMCQIVNSNSQRLQRMFLNAIYSRIFKVQISDEFTINSYDKKGITYGTLRVLIFLRNAKCDITQFFNWGIDIMSSDNLLKVDYTIFEVLGAYKKYVINPKNIDDLILVHKYTCDVWKNGAKHLYFYTLHNQEHAVDLIKNIIKIVKTFSYLKITGYDYYLLFIACYLHDVSMVRIASGNEFLLNDNESSTIIRNVQEKWDKGHDLGNMKETIFLAYKLLDTFFENKIRSRHGKDSAEEIRKRKDLDFLEKSVRENVAEIAESHMRDIKDIYFLKGDAQSKLISEKFDKILIRFADLLDMSEHRVSKPILNHNIDNMSSISAFHWVSHLLTEGYSLTSEYILEKNSEEYLKPGSITEKVTLSIYVNLSQFSKMESNHCRFVRLKDETIKNDGFELAVDGKCTSNKCNFLCRWFNTKNDYLVQEMQSLEMYLNRIPIQDRFYNSTIIIKVVIVNPTNLADEQFEILRKNILKKD